MLALYVNAYPDTEIFDGKSIGITGTVETKNGITIGDISGIICHESPWWSEFLRVPNKETALLPDWNEKSSIIADTCSDEDVRVIAGVPTWISVILDKVKKNKKEKDFWPNLELIAHGGVSFEPYKNLFKFYFGDKKIHYWQNYNASEGFFATQDKPDSEDMVLLIANGVFYEFVPLSDFHNQDYTKIVPLSKVAIGKEYALIITTNSGLIRYSIGDTVKFTSLSPYRIVITGRTKFFLNAFGEEIVVENTTKALAYAQKETGSVVRHYTVAPIFMNKDSSGYHSWYIEFEEEPQSLETFVKNLDEELKNINSDYRAKRSGGTILSEPKITIIPTGTFEKWLKYKNKFSPQSKVPPLSKDTSICDELDKFIQTN